jgi:hypothetical protein
MAPSAEPAIKAGAKGGGNVLTKKIGPLPGWAWAAIALGGYYFWKQRQGAAASTATTATPTASLPTSAVTAPSGYGYQGPGTGGGSSWGPGWNIGAPTGTTGTPGGTTAVGGGTPMIPYVAPAPSMAYTAPINSPTFLTSHDTGQMLVGAQQYPVGSAAANQAAIAAGVNPASLYQL